MTNRLPMACASAILVFVAGFSAASADKGANNPTLGQYRGLENQTELPNALRRVAASPKDYDALIQAIIGKDERAARSILSRNGHALPAPYKINFVSSSLKTLGNGTDVYLTVRQPGRFYGEPTPGWVGYVYIHGKGWYDMRTDTYIKSNEW